MNGGWTHESKTEKETAPAEVYTAAHGHRPRDASWRRDGFRERVFYLLQPDNLSVLSPEVIRGRIRSLTVLLSTQPSLEILALDSRESFQRNKEYYLRRLEEETEPAVQELLERDIAHLDAIQFSSASSRRFVLVIPLTEKMNADESALRQLEKTICDHGLRVRLAEEQDIKRLLAIYYQQDLTTEVFRDFDGEEYVAHG